MDWKGPDGIGLAVKDGIGKDRMGLERNGSNG